MYTDIAHLCYLLQRWSEQIISNVQLSDQGKHIISLHSGLSYAVCMNLSLSTSNDFASTSTVFCKVCLGQTPNCLHLLVSDPVLISRWSECYKIAARCSIAETMTCVVPFLLQLSEDLHFMSLKCCCKKCHLYVSVSKQICILQRYVKERCLMS